MFRPVSLLALDDVSFALATAVQQRVAKSSGLEDLVQARAIANSAELAPVLQSIHAQRQRPDNPLRLRDDVGSRELILLVLSASGAARTQAIDLARDVRQLYERRRFASAFTVELLCLMPEVAASTAYAAAYGLLKSISAADPKPFDEAWLLDAMNGNRVHFGSFESNRDTYADAVAGSLMFEPEMSGALPGLRPRGVDPTFSSFGYSSLIFPRDAALQRLEPRFAAELINDVLLSEVNADGVPALLRAKQFVANDAFALPLSRIGVEAGQSLFKRFQAKSVVSERTSSAEEVIAAARRELQVFRDNTHLQNLAKLSVQRQATETELTSLIARSVDETLDREGYAAALGLTQALIDPLPDLRGDADASASRNIVTLIHDATAALDARVRFTPNTAASDAARKRVRELDELLRDQQLVAETVAADGAAERLDEMRGERQMLVSALPDVLFREEGANNAARNVARDEEAARLASDTEAKEQQLRELFGQRPRAEQAVREALEARRTWLQTQLFVAIAGLTAIYAIPFIFKLLWPNLGRVHTLAGLSVGLFAMYAAFRYMTDIAPRVRAAREALARLITQIETADRAKNAAHADELQFEFEVAHRRTAIDVLQDVRSFAAGTLAALRTRSRELQDLATSLVPAPIVTSGLTLSIVDDAAIDAWYERTIEDRKPSKRELPIRRSQSLHLPFE
ncbi:MAG TPA: hypothetical protein VF911_01235, partial [Thermoanaerobaculia bacterium]